MHRLWHIVLVNYIIKFKFFGDIPLKTNNYNNFQGCGLLRNITEIIQNITEIIKNALEVLNLS